MQIGVLDIQGAVKEHILMLKKLNVDVVLVKKIEDLEKIAGLIIPGGESTTLDKLLKKYNLGDAILQKYKRGMKIWGTCAGAILLSKKIKNARGVEGLKLIDVEISRNAYGRQLDSFETRLLFDFGLKKTENREIEAVFIRAPKILKVGNGGKVLARHQNEIVTVRENGLLVTTFHPELTDDVSVHKYFVSMCKE